MSLLYGLATCQATSQLVQDATHQRFARTAQTILAITSQFFPLEVADPTVFYVRPSSLVVADSRLAEVRHVLRLGITPIGNTI